MDLAFSGENKQISILSTFPLINHGREGIARQSNTTEGAERQETCKFTFSLRWDRFRGEGNGGWC